MARARPDFDLGLGARFDSYARDLDTVWSNYTEVNGARFSKEEQRYLLPRQGFLTVLYYFVFVKYLSKWTFDFVSHLFGLGDANWLVLWFVRYWWTVQWFWVKWSNTFSFICFGTFDMTDANRGTMEQRWAYVFRMGGRQKEQEKIKNFDDFLAWWSRETERANRQHERMLQLQIKQSSKEQKEPKKEPKESKKERGKKTRGVRAASRAQ